MVTEWTMEQTNVGIFYADTFCAYLFSRIFTQLFCVMPVFAVNFVVQRNLSFNIILEKY